MTRAAAVLAVVEEAGARLERPGTMTMTRYNNSESTDFDDVRDVLLDVWERVRDRVQQQ